MSEHPPSISARLAVLWIAKALKHIDDHAKNIPDYVIFVVSGRDTRHTSADAGIVPLLAVTSA